MKVSSNWMTFSPISGGALPLSVLDLAQIPEGGTAQTALHRSRELAQRAEELGFRRFWLAEHHNMTAIASAATSVAIGFVAEGTSTIRVGAGGVMLPNHAPLVIAEQFGTLDALYPGRIDLGLGRAPGTDQATMRALRRDNTSADTFPADVQELQILLGDPVPSQFVHAVPGEGSHVPLWILGSSLFGAQLAAALGLPYAFASHFAPAALVPALQVYRESFRPSAQLAAPYAMLAANVIVADEDEQARKLFTSMQRSFIDGAFRRRRTLLPPPLESIEDYWHPHEREQLQSMLSCSFIGSPDTVRAGLEGFVAEHAPDELIVTTSAYDQDARLRSLELLAGLGVEAAVARR
jgi:luciferase family oxidoreductase group 1